MTQTVENPKYKVGDKVSFAIHSITVDAVIVGIFGGATYSIYDCEITGDEHSYYIKQRELVAEEDLKLC